jgi:ribosomal protein S18 acetylase RimI-like enzyme
MGIKMKITEMKIKDYDEVFSLWKKTEGLGLHKDADSKAGIARYLRRNPGFSFVARENGELVGTVLCGHDGRRGYIFHLAVVKGCRKKGIGKALIQKALSKLASIGMTVCLIFVFAKNRNGRKFWRRTGWVERPDIIMMVKDTGKENARKK